MTWGAGSLGYTSAARISLLIDHFYNLHPNEQTSAKFATLWSSRTAKWHEVEVPYLIGGGEATTSAAGWWAYLRRVHGSTFNTSTGGVHGLLELPTQVYRDFVADHAVLVAQSSHVHGTTDADHGRRLYEFLVSTAIVSTKWRRGIYKEFLTAWAAQDSSAVGTS